MFEEPLFQPHILSTMLRYFAYYFSYGNWIWQYIGAMFVIYGVYKFVTYKNVVTYPKFFPDAVEKKPFQKYDWFGIIFLLGCLSAYVFALYSQEMSFFQNYDTMSTNTMRLLKQGVTPMWGVNDRMAPVAFLEVNFVYAVTRNFYLINTFILFQTLLILLLIYKLLDFIPFYKRVLICSLFLISPAFFWVNNIIFPERMLLIYFISSLIFFKKYTREAQKSYFLFLSILFANFAMYTKETTILIFVGVMLYSLLYNVWNEKFLITNFFHPIRTCRQFPVEALLFLSIFFYILFYLLYVTDVFNGYLSLRYTNSLQTALFYKFEIIIILISLGIWLVNIKNRSTFSSDSLLIGSFCYICGIVFVFHLVPFSSYVQYNTYYSVLGYMIALVYLLSSLNNKKFEYMAAMIILCCSIFSGIKIHNSHEGKYYREVSVFLASQTEPVSIYISEHSEPLPWWISCWMTVFKYYWPDHQFLFHSSIFKKNDSQMLMIEYWNAHPELYPPFVYREFLKPNDFYVVKYSEKNSEDQAILTNINHEKVFSNKFFGVYRIK